MATKKKISSAVKAYRQNVKRRDHNRQLRSRLRSALKSHPRGHRHQRPAGRQDGTGRDVLSGGQDGQQGHHPQERGGPLQVSPRQARRGQGEGGVITPPSASSALPAQLHDQPFQQHPRVAARGLQGEVRAQQRVDGGRHPARRKWRPRASASGPRQPIWPRIRNGAPFSPTSSAACSSRSAPTASPRSNRVTSAQSST